jgi:hypothetical protein
MRKRFVLPLLFLALIFTPATSTQAQDNDPPTPPGDPPVIQVDESTKRYSYEQLVQFYRESGPVTLPVTVHVIEGSKTFAPLIEAGSEKEGGSVSPLGSVIIEDPPASMTATHVLRYRENPWWEQYDYDVWSDASTSSNYASYSIYVHWKHKWGGSCQNVLYWDDDTDYNDTYVGVGGPPVGFDSGTKHCIWGQHQAIRYSYPDYNLWYSGTFPTYTLP